MNNKELFLGNEFLLENLQGGVVYSDFDPPFRLKYCTEGMSELSGYSVDELLNMNQMDLVYEQDIHPLASDVASQLAVGDTFCVEYRLKRKDDSLVYVLDKAIAVLHDDGKKYIHCLLTDISVQKRMEHDLWLSQEKYKLALQQSGNVILEMDLSTNELLFSTNYKSVFNADAPTGTIYQIAKSDWLDSAYSESFLNIFDNVIKNKSTEAIELKLRQSDGVYIWGSLHLTAATNALDTAYTVVGCLKNINKEKEYISYLTELSEKDGLTGIYNRVYMEEKINLFVEENKTKGALAIIDIDYFKEINDTKGHACGDAVLRQLSDVIKSALPDSALLGRLGGDEYLVFLPEAECSDDLSLITKSVISAVAVASDNKTLATPTTLSIGAALSLHQNETFSSLYKRADKALYITKTNGRNGYTII